MARKPTKPKQAPPKPAPLPRTLAQANRWLNENWEKAVAHATSSTRRLIGRASL